MAAARFTRYWSKRRELFGTDKFHHSMTLAGALRDDTAALARLAQGVFSVVPKHDAFSRPIVIYSPHRNARTGFNKESMVSRFVESSAKEVLKYNSHALFLL